MKKLLLNYVYWSPVGHVLEAIKYARGFYESNKNIEISVILNKDSPLELIKLFPWIKKTYSIDLKSKNQNLEKFNKKWDYIVTDKRARDLYAMSHEMKKFHEKFFKEVSPRIWKGYTNYWKVGEESPLNYIPNTKISPEIPKNTKKSIERKIKSRKNICVLLGGSSSPGRYPPIDSWIDLLKKLKKRFPQYNLIITGVLKNNSGRTFTRAYGLKEIEKLKKAIPDIIDMYNIGLINQIELVKVSNLFISPHTGFGFISQVVGTPWLTISGGDWPEYFLNDTAFYSAIENLKYYPAYTFQNKPSKHHRRKLRKYLGFDDRNMRKRSKDILKGAKLLLEDKMDYKNSVKLHKMKLKKSKFKIGSFFFFDDIIKIKGLKKWLK
jgi:hypothetical protein